MAEIVSRSNVTGPNEDGWKVIYEIRRADGETVIADVSCTRTAEQTAKAHQNTNALESMASQGALDALAYADKVQSPTKRGATKITLYFNDIDGSLQKDVAYER